MNNKLLLYLFLIASCLTSCLPVKKTNYFQGEPDQNNENYVFNNPPYKLQVNDLLSININSDNEELVSLFSSSDDNGSSNYNNDRALYFNGYTIDEHGNIRIPYIGEINVLGYTEEEVRLKIEEELAKYFKNLESFFVSVKLSGIKFVVTGEVARPGTIILAQDQVTIVEAIANAGEISTYGNRQNVVVLRKNENGVEKFSLDMTDITVFDSEHFFIKPNDVIYVEALKRKSWGFGANGLQTFTTFATILTVFISTYLLIQTL